MEGQVPYSYIDKAIHDVAFGSGILQDLLYDIENTYFRKNWEWISAKRPIFITSLPRSATTILLDFLHRTGSVACHTYRDMPFVQTPVLWERLASGFRVAGKAKERAHGDGLLFDTESPEAFDEIIWKTFFPEKYHDHGIELWNSTSDTFDSYFRNHIKKVVFLRTLDPRSHIPYASKNNANIARVEVLKRLFPDASVLIPVRDPCEQAISLWFQHRNFLEIHGKDRFSRKYMEDIGHYEFGLLHRPILFPGVGELIARRQPEELDYWLEYWILTYQYLSEANGVSFLSHESFCSDKNNAARKLVDHLELPVSDELLDQASRKIKSSINTRKDKFAFDAVNADYAYDIYDGLSERCLLNRKNT